MLFEIGENNNAQKISPHLAAEIMKVYGTEKALEILNESFMVSETKQKIFQYKELLSEAEIKRYFGYSAQNLKTMIKNKRIMEANKKNKDQNKKFKENNKLKKIKINSTFEC